MAAVADTSPLILFARAGRLLLLRDIFTEVWIPPAVRHEASLDDPSRPGAAELASALGDWLHERAPGDEHEVALLALSVDRGEAEAIVLARERGLLLLIDDLAGRRAAGARGMAIIGSAGVLGLAKRIGAMSLVSRRSTTCSGPACGSPHRCTIRSWRTLAKREHERALA